MNPVVAGHFVLGLLTFQIFGFESRENNPLKRIEYIPFFATIVQTIAILTVFMLRFIRSRGRVGWFNYNAFDKDIVLVEPKDS